MMSFEKGQLVRVTTQWRFASSSDDYKVGDLAIVVRAPERDDVLRDEGLVEVYNQRLMRKHLVFEYRIKHVT